VFSANVTQFALNITYIVIAVLGMLGNLLTLIVICTHAPIRNKLPNYYFINQTIVDFLLSILLIPSMTDMIVAPVQPTYLYCLIWESRALFRSLYLVSVYSILALSLERYVEVVHPVWQRLNVTQTKVV